MYSFPLGFLQRRKLNIPRHIFHNIVRDIKNSSHDFYGKLIDDRKNKCAESLFHGQPAFVRVPPEMTVVLKIL